MEIPDILLEVFVSQEKKISEVNNVSIFATGDWGSDLKYNWYTYFNEDELEALGFLENIEPNSIFHVYMKGRFSSFSTLDGYDSEFTPSILYHIRVC